MALARLPEASASRMAPTGRLEQRQTGSSRGRGCTLPEGSVVNPVPGSSRRRCPSSRWYASPRRARALRRRWGRLEQRQTRSNPDRGCTLPEGSIVAGADSVDMIRGGSCECDAAACVQVERRAFVHAAFDRSGEAAGIFQKMVDGFGTILLSADEVEKSTIHLANKHLVEALESAHAIGCTADFLSQMLDGWGCKLEGDARRIWQGEKCREYIFLFSNAYDVLLIMRGRGATFSNEELESMLSAMFRRYKASYFDECWAPLMNHLDRFDKFSDEFCIICRRQMTRKVTANLRYKLRQEIVDLIVPQYQVSFLAQRKNRSRLSRLLHCRKRIMAGKKEQKMRKW